MALQLLDGTNATIDISFNAISYKCVASYWSADLDRQFFESTVFCSGGWVDEIGGKKQLIGRMDGFASSGYAGSDPLALFNTSFQSTGFPFVLTANTGCYISGNANASRVHTGMRAALQSEFAIDFKSKGAVTTVWIVS